MTDKVKKVMEEWKAGKLHSGSKKGPIVKKRGQAIAIALDEAREAGQKVSPPPGRQQKVARLKERYKKA